MLKGKLILFLLTAGLLVTGAHDLSAQGSASSCPPVLASLMPKNAVKVAGQYNSAGMIGMGFAAGNLPFEHPCLAGDKYPGHISVEVQHYSGEGVTLFKMQIDAVEKQGLQNEKEEMERRRPRPGNNASLDKVSDLKEEKVPGGTLLYYDYYTDCSEGTKRSHPTVSLYGFVHNESTSITIKIDGFISAEVARAAALEVIANLPKADFGKP
jgi:hypothetical protein